MLKKILLVNPILYDRKVVFYDRKVKALQPYMDSVLRIYLSSMVLLPGKDCYQGLLRDPYGA